ncbi:hypothetical protein AR457_33745 [Streptomyces agglomeratus]|nr:hypothetical protein BGK70_31395 [Streptomyces agglomeratus]OEJ42084.1 hypothetical protein BGK70_02930 [Streptomyces agglomeratus]OEJ49402.1 hypothetical protein AR457_33745 [Streptomyces agglomeratus]OEJ62767.1 hypothetical protein BGM19_03055 [Streptomyces agglomeratus]
MLVAAAITTLSVGCASSSGGGGESASTCAFMVEYDKRRYIGTDNTDISVGDELGAASRPPCDDTPNDNSDGKTTASSTTAYTVEGVGPALAIAVGDAPDDVRLVVIDSGKELPPEIKKMINRS